MVAIVGKAPGAHRRDKNSHASFEPGGKKKIGEYRRRQREAVIQNIKDKQIINRKKIAKHKKK